MPRDFSTGPSATEPWAVRQTVEGEDSPSTLSLADAANEKRLAEGLAPINYVLPSAPRLCLSASGRPQFQLSLLLNEKPRIAQDGIFELIQSGSFSCGLTLEVQPRKMLAGDTPLFARHAQLCLKRADDGSAYALLESKGTGTNIHLGLGGVLDAEMAKAVLLALNGRSSNLILACAIHYRVAPATTRVEATFDWVTIHDYIAGHIKSGEEFSQSTLTSWIRELLANSVIDARIVEPTGKTRTADISDADAVTALLIKVGVALLERQVHDSGDADPVMRFKIRARPALTPPMKIALSVTYSAEATTEISAPLETVIGNVLERQDADDILHLTYVNPLNASGVSSVPQRSVVKGSSRAKGGLRLARMMESDGKIMALNSALLPSRAERPTTAALFASDILQPHATLHNNWVVQDQVLLFPQPEIFSPDRPILDGDAEVLNSGNRTGTKFYLPRFVLVSDPAADVDSAPFQFTFREVGHDNAGKPVLAGEVVFTLRKQIPSGGTQEVAIEGLSISLILPMRDANGAPTTASFMADISEQNGVVTGHVSLTDQFVRLAYGDLAIENFQSDKAKLEIRYSFQGLQWEQLEPWDLPPTYEKINLTPIALNRIQASTLQTRGSFLNAENLVYKSSTADVQFRVEKSVPKKSAGDPAHKRDLVSAAMLKPQVSEYTMIQPNALAAVAHPQLVPRSYLVQITQPVSVSIDIAFPCSDFGAFYRQNRGDKKVSIGCSNSFSLGQMPLKLYEEVTESVLSYSSCKIFRSLLQPGRFVILPKAYKITRFDESDAARKFKPSIYMFSTLDAASATNNRCTVLAALQPDIPLWVRKDVFRKLKAMSHNPVIAFATEIESELSYTWQISAGSHIETQVTKLWDCFQVALSTDLAGGLQLQAMLTNGGIAAHVDFRLTDGNKLGQGSDLVIDLGAITGPFSTGPIKCEVLGNSASITNMIENSINVSEIAAYHLDGTSDLVPVDRKFAAGEAVSITLPPDTLECFPIYTLQASTPSQLSEVSAFVENVHTNVVFVNLVNFANHTLSQLAVTLKFQSMAGSEKTLTLNPTQQVAEANYTLPLTQFLQAQILQFQVSKTDTSGQVTQTGWITWDLKQRGNVISLTWDNIQ
jgi:hypothetical protein